MQPVILIFVLAAFGEVVIEVLKPLLAPAGRGLARLLNVTVDDPYLYLSSAFGLLLSFTYGVNVLSAVGVDVPNATAHYTGLIATGLILGRGANFVHDAIARFAGEQERAA